MSENVWKVRQACYRIKRNMLTSKGYKILHVTEYQISLTFNSLTISMSVAGDPSNL